MQKHWAGEPDIKLKYNLSYGMLNVRLFELNILLPLFVGNTNVLLKKMQISDILGLAFINGSACMTQFYYEWDVIISFEIID